MKKLSYLITFITGYHYFHYNKIFFLKKVKSNIFTAFVKLLTDIDS